jgi:UDP-glucuronate 4-epimerase
MLEGKSIDVYNYGKMKRDFTYIDDIVEAVGRMDIIPQPNPEWTVETGSRQTAPRHTGCITSVIARRLS